MSERHDPSSAHLPSDPTLSYKPDELEQMLDRALTDPSTPAPDTTKPGQETTAASTGFQPRQGYNLGRMIAEGGAGEVWTAEQFALSREVAIKRIREHRLESAKKNKKALDFILLQFEQEALTSANLEHPNILPIYDLSVDEQGHPLLAMKRVRGTPWPILLDEDFSSLSVDDYLTRHIPTLLDAAQAVAYAHSRGIIHRDIKPSQIMVGKFGEVLLMDWGLAIGFEGASTSDIIEPITHIAGLPTLVNASSPAGTPAYMAPEQTESSARHVGPWTDVYLLGGTLFYILTGQPPHPLGSSDAVFENAKEGIIMPLEEAAPGRPVPSQLRSLVADALNPARGKRIQSAQEFVARLQDYISGTSKRKESARITSEVAASIERGGKEYREYGEALGELGNAGLLWPRNPEVSPLRKKVLVDYTRAAIANGDLTMARAQAEQLEQGPEQDELMKEIDQREKRAEQREQQRRFARRLAGVLLAATLIVAVIAIIQARRASTAANAAQRAAQEARFQQELAEAMGKKAEREQYFAAIGYANATLPQYNTRRIRNLLDSISPELQGWEWHYLERAIASEESRLEAPFQLLSVAYSNDGSLVAMGGETPEMLVYDPASGEKRFFSGHRDKIYYMDFSPDDSRIATASKDDTIRIWDVETAEELRILQGHQGFVNSVDYHPEEPEVVSASSDGTIRFWDLVTGRSDEVSITDGVASAAFYNSTGDRVVVAGSGGIVTVVDAESREVIASYSTPSPSAFTCARFSPDGKYIAASGWDGVAYILDAGTGKLLHTLSAHDDTVYRFAFTPDSKRIILPSNDHTITVWNLNSGELQFRIIGHEASIWSAAVSPDGMMLATASYDRTLRFWNLDKMDPRAFEVPESELPNRDRIESVRVFYSDDSSLESADDEWDVDNGRRFVRVQGDVYEIQHGASVFSPDGRYRVMLDASGRVVDTETGTTLARLASRPLTTAVFSPDGKYLALASDAVYVFTTDNWQQDFAVPNSDLVNQMVFDSQSRQLALNTLNSITQIWNIDTREQVSVLDDGQPMGIYAIAFSPDGRYVATGHSPSYDVRVWQVDSGEEAYKLVGHSFRLFGIDFNPNGSRIATISWDNTLRLWEAGTGREVLVPQRTFDGALLGVKFSRDGSRLIAPTSTGEVEVWKAR